MCKISIVVPFYNTEKYLGRCLDSLINQTYENIEIICVNDGSEDNSLRVAEEYGKQDKRIKIISQENKGVSAARNQGIDISSGEYIMFVDSDDTLELNACEELIKKFQDNSETDIIAFSSNILEKNKKYEFLSYTSQKPYSKYNNISFRVFGNEEKFLWNMFIGAPIIYKTKIITENKIKYPENFSIAEDYIFIIKIFKLNPTIMFLDKALYNYDLNRENSLSKVGSLKYVYSYKNDHIEKFLVKLFSNGILEEENNFKKAVYNLYCLRIIDRWTDLYFSENKKEHIQILDELAKGNKKLFIEEKDIKKMKFYSYYKKFKIMSFFHLGYFYFNCIRPILRK